MGSIYQVIFYIGYNKLNDLLSTNKFVFVSKWSGLIFSPDRDNMLVRM